MKHTPVRQRLTVAGISSTRNWNPILHVSQQRQNYIVRTLIGNYTNTYGDWHMSNQNAPISESLRQNIKYCQRLTKVHVCFTAVARWRQDDSSCVTLFLERSCCCFYLELTKYVVYLKLAETFQSTDKVYRTRMISMPVQSRVRYILFLESLKRDLKTHCRWSINREIDLQRHASRRK